ncbi:MAG TPA: alpha/beta hydrolase [Methylibium sp.]|nr:alpha/beta hydrolase [Methylibium sp.]
MSAPATETWVLLRGLTRERRHWGGFVAALQAARPAARIVAPDLPGNGARRGEASPRRVEAMTEALRAALHADGAAPPYRLLALSLGAMVAVDWATRHPHELAGAALINTSLRPYSPFWQRLRPRAWTALLRIALATDPRARESAVLALTAAQPTDAGALLDEWAAWRRSHPVTRANALRQLVAAARYRAPAAAPPVPLLLLAGARDALVDPRCSRRLAAAWRLPLAEHPHAGHDLPLDDAAWVIARLRDWPAAAPQSPPASPATGPRP